MKNRDTGGWPGPKDRKEFEHNVYLTAEEVKYKVENNLRDPGLFSSVVPSLERVMLLPNNRINLNTVDEKLRLHSNMMNWMESEAFQRVQQKAIDKNKKKKPGV